MMQSHRNSTSPQRRFLRTIGVAVVAACLLLAAACKSTPEKRDRDNTVGNESEKLITALETKDFAAAKAALKAKANPNEEYHFNRPWLFIALEHGFDWGELFYDNGADLDRHDYSGSSALLLMTDQRKYETMRWLLKRGANPNKPGIRGYSPLLLAYIHEDETSLKLLRSFNASEDIFTYAVSGNATGLKTLLESGANPNEVRRNGASALAYAAGYGKVECVKVLLAFKADINWRDESMLRTALLNVTLSDLPNKAEVVSTLIAGGADINLPDYQGMTPLLVAAQRQDNDIVKLLVDAGANVNAKSANGARALSYVTDLETEKLLLAKRAKCGDRPRFTCARGGQRTEKAEVIAGDGLYLRDQPSIEGNKLTLMRAGAQVLILSRAPGKDHEYHDKRSGVWCRVKYKGREGYAFSGFLE